MSVAPPDRSSLPRSRRALLGVLLMVLALAVAAAGLLAHRRIAARAPRTIRIAGGAPGGSYLPIAAELAAVLEREVPGVRASAVETGGSAENVRRLEAGEVDLALVQNDAPGGRAVRAIAPLYQEVLHIIVRGALADPADLRGKRVSVGPAGGGTESVAREVLGHFGVGEGDVALLHLGLADAAAALEKGEIDAAFVLAGLRARGVERLLAAPGARLLSLGDPDRAGSALAALELEAPFLAKAVIPERTYGAVPAAPVGTLGVGALLVARADMPDPVAREVTRALFDSKVALAERAPALGRLTERFDPATVRFPLHRGAVQYLHRDDPPLILAWADTISLGITIILLVGSAGLTAREAMRRAKKDRIDVYYLEVQAVGQEVKEDARAADLAAAKQRLERLRRRAFDDLVAERLLANESFTIFQDYLRSELLEIERLAARRREDE